MFSELNSAQLFIPGRASFVTTSPEGNNELHLTEASQHRANVAAEVFSEDGYHTTALFAGGYPGLAEGWPDELTPEPEDREAYLMALPLESRLRRTGWNETDLKNQVHKQGDSNNSIGDVAESIAKGYLRPDDFQSASNRHGIELVTGALHGLRFRLILGRALDMDLKLIHRVPMRDVYGRPASQYRPAEAKPVAITKEAAGIALTTFALKDVRPGNVDDLREAEARLNTIVSKRVA